LARPRIRGLVSQKTPRLCVSISCFRNRSARAESERMDFRLVGIPETTAFQTALSTAEARYRSVLTQFNDFGHSSQGSHHAFTNKRRQLDTLHRRWNELPAKRASGLQKLEAELLVTYQSRPPSAALPAPRACAPPPASGCRFVYVEFGWETEIYRARQQVAERLAGVQGRLPHGVQPQMGPISSMRSSSTKRSSNRRLGMHWLSETDRPRCASDREGPLRDWNVFGRANAAIPSTQTVTAKQKKRAPRRWCVA
jgi:hypothetical protein